MFKRISAFLLAWIILSAIPALADQVVTIYSADGLHDGNPNWYKTQFDAPHRAHRDRRLPEQRRAVVYRGQPQPRLQDARRRVARGERRAGFRGRPGSCPTVSDTVVVTDFRRVGRRAAGNPWAAIESTR